MPSITANRISTTELFSQWARNAADSLAFAVTVTAAVLDLDAVVIAGGLPHDRVVVVEQTHVRLLFYNTKGLHLRRSTRLKSASRRAPLGGFCPDLYAFLARA